MAKRKPLQDRKKAAAEAQKDAAFSRSWHSSTIINPSNPAPPLKKAVAKARAKHRHDNDPTPAAVHPTLAGRFHALPGELRNRIFSLLLVTHVKWDRTHSTGNGIMDVNFHDPPCLLRSSNASLTDEHFSCTGVCAHDLHYSTWRELILSRLANDPIFISPWRSRWAPEQRNGYVCTFCYDSRLREQPFPRAKTFPCLCARRQDLQVLLVCKRWYAEAAQVFYTQNTFAFEDASVFVDFITNLPPRWRGAISRVSIMTMQPTDAHAITSEDQSLTASWPILKKTRHALLRSLRSLPSLYYLELDIAFLTHLKAVRSLLTLGLRNLKQMCFVERLPDDTKWTQGTETVWPAFAGRKLIVGGLAEEVARAIKGQRQRRLKEKGVLEREVRIWRGEVVDL